MSSVTLFYSLKLSQLSFLDIGMQFPDGEPEVVLYFIDAEMQRNQAITIICNAMHIGDLDACNEIESC